jgi:hypothetical protein
VCGLTAMSDIEKSFTFLHDSIPQWLQDVAGLEEKVVAMQQDIVRISASMSPFPKHTTSSTHSINQEKMDAVPEDAAPPHGTPTEPLASRKRKTQSVLSGRASGPSRYRRTMVVVTYDGDMQKSFELLVRAIGTGRNMLRKAKMEAKMNELAALAGSSEDEDEADEDEEEAVMAKISYRPRMSSMRTRAAAMRGARHGGSGGAATPVALFDTTDKALELAQSLCEKASHVILREGDCRTELGAMRKSFVDVLETAKTQVAKCDAAKLLEPQALSSTNTSDTSISSAEDPPYKKHFPQLSRPPPELQMKNTSLSIPATIAPQFPNKTMEIEVDDDEDDDDEPDFVLPHVRYTSRFSARA